MVTKARGSVLTKGLAGAAALAGATQAYGNVVVRPLPANINGNNPTNTSTATVTRTIDVDGNGTTDLQVRYRSFTTGGYQIQQSFVFSQTGKVLAAGPTGGSGDQYYAYQLGAGAVIPGAYQLGQSATFLTHVATNIDGSDYGYWALGDRGFIGFTFLNAASQLVSGYLEMRTNAFPGSTPFVGVEFFSLAYETDGGSINAGEVPEPSTLAALAFGGLGLAAAAYKRRKQA